MQNYAGQFYPCGNPAGLKPREHLTVQRSQPARLVAPVLKTEGSNPFLKPYLEKIKTKTAIYLFGKTQSNFWLYKTRKKFSLAKNMLLNTFMTKDMPYVNSKKNQPQDR